MSASKVCENISCTPPEVAGMAKTATEMLMPTKSTKVYEKSFERFSKWCQGKQVTKYTESVLLAYFSDLKMKSSTMWSHYSMVKSVLGIRHGIDIGKYIKLKAYIKRQGEGYYPKKSKVFTKDEFEKFVFEAPDNKYLAMKVKLQYLFELSFDV